MAKIRLGDIFEINTLTGKAYFQCMHSDKLEGELIKVFNHIFDRRPENIDQVLMVEGFYYIGFPLKDALKKKIVKHFGQSEIPKGFKILRYTRSEHIVRGEFKGWHIIDTENEKRILVKELTDEQRKLSPSGIINDRYLIERLEEGWSLDKWV